MKALALVTAAAVTLFSVAASAQTYGVPYGKGQSPAAASGCHERLVRLGGRPFVPVPFFWGRDVCYWR